MMRRFLHAKGGLGSRTNKLGISQYYGLMVLRTERILVKAETWGPYAAATASAYIEMAWISWFWAELHPTDLSTRTKTWTSTVNENPTQRITSAHVVGILCNEI